MPEVELKHQQAVRFQEYIMGQRKQVVVTSLYHQQQLVRYRDLILLDGTQMLHQHMEGAECYLSLRIKHIMLYLKNQLKH